jgi:plasmid rolling circle replication initiator protein Rep
MNNTNTNKNVSQALPEDSSNHLASYSSRDSIWDDKRNQAITIEGHYDEVEAFERLAFRMHDCANRLGFAIEPDKQTGECKLKLRSGMFCKVRHCPVCMWRRSRKNVARLNAKLPELRKQFPTHRFLFLTLTVPNPKYEDLRETVKKMNAGFQRLIQLNDWPAEGFIRAVEVTNEEKTKEDIEEAKKNGKTLAKGRKGYCHPHFHVLLCVKASYFSHGFIKQEDWLKMWQDSMRDETITQVDIRVIRSKKDGDDALNSAILETLKYQTKMADIVENKEFLYCLTSQLHKMRFLSSGGILKDILKEEMSNAEMIEGDDTEEKQDDEEIISFTFDKHVKHYIREIK